MNLLMSSCTLYARFFRTNRLALHPKKTQYILFTKNQDAKSTNLPLYLNNNNPNLDVDVQQKIPITRIHGTENDPAIKFLGIYIDPSNDFKYHVGTVAKNSQLHFTL